MKNKSTAMEILTRPLNLVSYTLALFVFGNALYNHIQHPKNLSPQTMVHEESKVNVIKMLPNGIRIRRPFMGIADLCDTNGDGILDTRKDAYLMGGPTPCPFARVPIRENYSLENNPEKFTNAQIEYDKLH